MSQMRSTVRIDEFLMMQLRELAEHENVSLTRMLNRLLREGIEANKRSSGRKTIYREETVSMGTPRLGMDKALSRAAELEDQEVLTKIALRK